MCADTLSPHSLSLLLSVSHITKEWAKKLRSHVKTAGMRLSAWHCDAPHDCVSSLLHDPPDVAPVAAQSVKRSLISFRAAPPRPNDATAARGTNELHSRSDDAIRCNERTNREKWEKTHWSTLKNLKVGGTSKGRQATVTFVRPSRWKNGGKWSFTIKGIRRYIMVIVL